MSIEGYLLLLCSLLLFIGGIVHAIVGERVFLNRLSMRADLAQSSATSGTQVQIYRVVWHVLAVACWAAAALLFLIAQGPLSSSQVLSLMGIACLIAGGLMLMAARGYYLGWLLCALVSVITFYLSGVM